MAKQAPWAIQPVKAFRLALIAEFDRSETGNLVLRQLSIDLPNCDLDWPGQKIEVPVEPNNVLADVTAFRLVWLLVAHKKGSKLPEIAYERTKGMLKQLNFVKKNNAPVIRQMFGHSIRPLKVSASTKKYCRVVDLFRRTVMESPDSRKLIPEIRNDRLDRERLEVKIKKDGDSSSRLATNEELEAILNGVDPYEGCLRVETLNSPMNPESILDPSAKMPAFSTSSTVREPFKLEEKTCAEISELPQDNEATCLQVAHLKSIQSGNSVSCNSKDQTELRQLVPQISLVANASEFKIDISRIIKFAPAELIGRESELAILSDAWNKVRHSETPRPRVLTFVALGGEGKTSLVAKWVAELAHQDWPGCDSVFAWCFYSQGTGDQVVVSSDLFLAAALTFFGDAAMANSAVGAIDKGRRLAQLVCPLRALLILDGLELLQYALTSPTPGELNDHGLAALLKGLAANNHGLCIVTTRYSIPDLRVYWQTTAPETKIPRLSMAAGVELIRSLGVKGTLRPSNGSERVVAGGSRRHLNEFETLVEDVKGHALTLNLLGSYLRDAHGGDIRRRDLVKLEEADAEEQGGHAFRVMDAYVKSLEADTLSLAAGDGRGQGERGPRMLALLSLIGLFDRPATADCLMALLQPPAIPGLTTPLVGLNDVQRNLALTRLENARLLTVIRHGGSCELIALDAHPLLREYFAQRVKERQPEAWRAAHRRLYEHLCETAPTCTIFDGEGNQPTLEDLQPLYQAVVHGCNAGNQEETYIDVYRRRISRSRDYAVKRFGVYSSDLGIIVCFFDNLWTRAASGLKPNTNFLLAGKAAGHLRALGRFSEARELFALNLSIDKDAGGYIGASRWAGELSELDLILGNIARAIDEAWDSIGLAGLFDDPSLNCDAEVKLLHALHEAGHHDEAEEHFRVAEDLQSKSGKKDFFSTHSFYFCDLLMGRVERVAWRVCLESRLAATKHPTDKHPPAGFFDIGPRYTSGEGETPNEQCSAVSECVTQKIMRAEQAREVHLLPIALDRLTLGRAALYAAVLSAESLPSFILVPSHLESAVSGLRRAGTTHHIPRGLLTRAWLRSLTGPRVGPESAQSDLDEAWEIAERGPMPLFMADVCLYRARLFGVRGRLGSSQSLDVSDEKYPWKSAEHDLSEARRLIEKHGYWRRKEELEDAEAALLGKSHSP